MIEPVGDADPTWYQRAVFYEVLTSGFRDSNGDGIGDIPGIIEKLDHFAWLGVDCIWLLPFYKSPLRDNGYDISDYLTVHPEFGNVADVAHLLDEAHQRGIRVIADLVVNHTSDQHPWFVESSSSRDNPRADWYVWSDEDTRWPEARVIFIDTEPSNWSWHPVRGQYYWHRFFDHQPDLNYDCPEVSDAMFDVMSHWLAMGLDGMRLDAVPYLFERDGTNGENLQETHQWLRELRQRVDDAFPHRVLLAEANQPPEQVVEYFGDGDECHMAFHFPVMPRMFKSLRDHQASTIIDVLDETPVIPETCQWGLFLRNHDELTLEMVTRDEYDFMLAEYAPEPGMRRNVGIGRRLFPLLGDDRRQAELLHSLLFSLPGSPVIYYGDEIGMGERMELPDRDPVRLPMQWDAGPNGGFSDAPPEDLYLPSLDEGPYGYPTRNVAAQTADPHSFLNWLRWIISVRAARQEFATGRFRILETDHDSVLAYVRNGEATSTLCVASVSNEEVVATVSLGDLRVGSTIARCSHAAHVESPGPAVTLPPFGWEWFDIL